MSSPSDALQKRLVEAEDADCFRGVALGEFAGEVGVETFGSKGDENVDYQDVSRSASKVSAGDEGLKTQHILGEKE